MITSHAYKILSIDDETYKMAVDFDRNPYNRIDEIFGDTSQNTKQQSLVKIAQINIFIIYTLCTIYSKL